ncbi:MAG TPA: polymer-forming cytoskeletal protein [Candidatus Cybelea sp.]|nr:polymer-forming cytoskeletal protein [Candidatus Cybelea sp.]
MAWNIFDRNKQASGEWSGFLEQGARIEGKLELPGTFRIDSRVKGSIVSEHVLIVGERGSIEGDISGNLITIGGRMEGTIQARNRVEIQTRAIVTGEIQTPCLIIEPGAMFEGRCHIVTAQDPSKPITIPIRSIGTRT